LISSIVGEGLPGAVDGATAKVRAAVEVWALRPERWTTCL
jgi:hypothetical protein